MIRLVDLLKEDVIEKTSAIPAIQESLDAVKALGDKTLLTRRFSGVRMGVAKVTSGPITKGRIGLALNPSSPVYNKEVADKIFELADKFKMKHIVYCSHGKSIFYFGSDSYIMIPEGSYKTVWSPVVKDLYADLKTHQENKDLDEFPMASYKDEWPKGDVAEVLVDCESYFLITLETPIIKSYMMKNKIPKPKTYMELYEILTKTLEKFSK